MSRAATPLMVGLYIMSAYWFIASTSFANQAVTIRRSFSNTFGGIALKLGAEMFILAQPRRRRRRGRYVRLAFEGADRAMSEDFPITIFRNPDCGTSRNALAMIRAAGYAPTVVEYLKTGWTRPRLEQLLAAMGASPRDILREKGTPAVELGLLDEAVSDDAILQAMIEHPILVKQPVVEFTPGRKARAPVGSGAGATGTPTGRLHQGGRRGGDPAVMT